MRKGKTNNPNGRPKGIPNKTTSEIKEFLTKIVSDNKEQIERDLRELEPKERLQILEKFIQYVVPKMQNVQSVVDIKSISDEQIDEIINNLNYGE